MCTVCPIVIVRSEASSSTRYFWAEPLWGDLYILLYVFANNPPNILGKGSFNKFIQLAESWIDRCIDYIKIDRDREIERKKDR